MIEQLRVEELETARKIWQVQIPSYQVEAKLINFDQIPPLRESVEDLQRCEETFYGYWIGEELAGAISYKREGDALDIHRMMVHPQHFRKGVASKLLAFVEQVEEGVQRILVATGARNVPAVNLYLRHGFHQVGEQEVAPGVFLALFEKSAISK